MQLRLAIHPITTIRFGSKTALDGKTLVVDREELSRLVLEDHSFSSVEFEIVQPGESCRAGPVFDIIEPRAKGADSSPDFPGILGPPQTAGMGTTHVLEGAAVTVLKETGAGDSRGAPGYVLEMSGEAAIGTKYASLHHLIVIPHSKSGVPDHTQKKAYRVAGLKTAVYLARAAMDKTPVSTDAFEPVGPGANNREGLPRVAYIGQIFSRQRKPELGEPILYAADTDGMLPVLLHPDEWLDGALVPSYHNSLGGAETYFYQNHPVINELYRRHHAQEVNFVGTVATIAAGNNFDRDRNCRFAANLARWALKADAAVLTKFGGGAPHADLAETARRLEHMGVKTAVQVTDLARDRRVESALLFNFTEVNAIVCIGGNSTSWQAPRLDRVIAASPEMVERLRGPFELEAMSVIGVSNQQGVSRLRAMIY
jgi:glycine reductase complex component B subunit alpha and beta